MTINLDELERSALAMTAADARLMDIGEGVGGLGIHHPEMLEDWRAWQDSSENSHADTVLGLIAELRTERKRADDAVATLDSRWEHSEHLTAKYYRRMRAAELALADAVEAERSRIIADLHAWSRPLGGSPEEDTLRLVIDRIAQGDTQ